MSKIEKEFVLGEVLDPSDLNSMVTAINDKAEASTTLEGYGIEDAYTKEEVDNAIEKKSSNIIYNSDDTADLDIADENGNVLARFVDGGLETENFHSVNYIEYSAIGNYVSGIGLTLSVTGEFKTGEVIYFHIIDNQSPLEWGRYASYFEGNKEVIANQRGSNSYIKHIITNDCTTVGAVIPTDGYYTDGLEITLKVYKIYREVEPTIITVATDNSGMYTTLKAAVDSITDANHLTNPYVIEVKKGTYNTLEGFTEEEIQSAGSDGSSMVGLLLTDGISMRGVGGTCDEIILTAELSKTDYSSIVRGEISTLNLQGSNFIENMTIVATNLRYCVHDDSHSPINTVNERVVRNVKFKGYNLSYTPATTYGAGMAVARNCLFENCDFGYDLNIHTNGSFTKSCTVTVNNCTGNKFKILDYATAETDSVNRFIINDCNFDIIFISHNHEDISQHITIEGCGNEQSIIKCPSTFKYFLGMNDKTTTGFTVGTLVARTTSNYEFFEATSNIDIAYGVIIDVDNDYSYIQRCGYVSSEKLGLSGLSIGDYVTVTDNVVVTGGTKDNAVGVVTSVDGDGIAYIKLKI